MGDALYYERLKTCLKDGGKAITYDDIYDFYFELAEDIKNGVVSIYDNETLEVFNPNITKSDINGFTSGSINARGYATKMTKKAIEYYRQERITSINIPKSIIDGMDKLVVVKHHEGSFIYRWHHDNPKSCTEREKAKSSLDAGDYVNYAEYFRSLIRNTLELYPNSEFAFVGSTGRTTGLMPTIKNVYQRVRKYGTIPLHRKLSDTEAFEYSFDDEIIGAKPLRRGKDRLKAGIYVNAEKLERIMGQYQLIIRGIDCETDKPKQKAKKKD